MTERCGLVDIAALPDAALPVVRVVVANVEGSTPREAGAAMLVTREGTTGTIGGGQLEFEAIAHARALLKAPLTHPPSGGSPLKQGERATRQTSAPSRQGEGANSPHPPPSALSLDGRGRREAPGEGGAAPIAESCPAASWLRDMRVWPLGPSLGQCCGGAVRVLFESFGNQERQTLSENIATGKATGIVLRPVASGEPLAVLSTRQQARDLPLHIARAASDMLSGARPGKATLLPARKGAEPYFIEPIGAETKPLFIYGAGHVGRAIVRAIAELDFAVSWVDVSAGRFPGAVPDAVRQIIAENPADVAQAAPEAAYHLVLTYSHALDLAICHALLANPIFGFLGLIGSGSKRARFLKRLGEGRHSARRALSPHMPHRHRHARAASSPRPSPFRLRRN